MVDNEKLVPHPSYLNKSDNVNSPRHYTTGNIEVIDYIQDNLQGGFESYCIGNVIKYISRYKHKNGVEDLKKSRFYLERVIKELDDKND